MNVPLKAHDEDSYREQQLRRAVEDAVNRAIEWRVVKPSFKDTPGAAVKTFPDKLREKLKETEPRHYDDALRAI